MASRSPWSGRRLVGEAGLEPAKAKPADLQSAPFAARDIPPLAVEPHGISGKLQAFGLTAERPQGRCYGDGVAGCQPPSIPPPFLAPKGSPMTAPAAVEVRVEDRKLGAVARVTHPEHRQAQYPRQPADARFRDRDGGAREARGPARRGADRRGRESLHRRREHRRDGDARRGARAKPSSRWSTAPAMRCASVPCR